MYTLYILLFMDKYDRIHWSITYHCKYQKISKLIENVHKNIVKFTFAQTAFQ